MNSTDSGSATGDGGESEPQASDPLELFFDLVFVFAFTRVTAFVSHHLTWAGVIRGVALIAALWWAWVTYTWLMDTIPAETVLSERVVILAATAVIFVVALAVPNAFGTTATLFGGSYFVVRVLHVALSVYTTRGETRARFLRLMPGFLGGPALLLAAGFADGSLQSALWIVGLAIDYGVLYVRGVAKFEVRVEHFVERYRDIIIIAFGESVLAMGFGIAGDEPTLPPAVLAAAVLGIVLVMALSWLYFDYVSVAAEERFAAAGAYERGVLARNSYAYLHLPIITGILFVAFGLEVTVVHVSAPLETIPAVGLYGGSALYLVGHTVFRLHDTGSLAIARLGTAALAVALIPVATGITALASLAVLTGLLVGLVILETVSSGLRRDVLED
ncbi:low temperature requirement protein A [Natrinema sp. 74]|uniref:low temperature requirement protein A n=1 Tax=Natrinema sp. 74 TaxID=3384159 RepID=UPI0038D4E4CA